ncbi:MAG: transcription elongation factor GreA [Mobiluncus porci]|uniref:Transcription elongation factor GreA n=1 Tax=Mobiluncus porci TaxID=2652278 RepID=A0A7K0K4G0_9ACTO|nr:MULTISPECIES: transcription elongation factor GreA [Mobiluncus]MCI6583796.1 transcription elongation factor GreA [Mobiluncus sp.]MDD7542578.1 transcription elongation factor GreA [Mobiluncus porci]MDY5749166.1 transcription elongation factor GreA [Mobiluncus porci]MST49950.1 transcription elongation factor GreA [Mobiluncus porci]
MAEEVKKKWMTQASYDRLQKELEERTGPIRSEITKKIDLARREGDLKENGGYHAARDEQSHNETRILELEEILKHAEVGEAADDGIVTPGMVVEAKVGTRKMKFLLGSRDADDGLNIDVFSPEAPLGAALLGHKAGDKVEYATPAGKTIKVEVLSVAPFEG